MDPLLLLQMKFHLLYQLWNFIICSHSFVYRINNMPGDHPVNRVAHWVMLFIQVYLQVMQIIMIYGLHKILHPEVIYRGLAAIGSH